MIFIYQSTLWYNSAGFMGQMLCGFLQQHCPYGHSTKKVRFA